MSTLRQDLRSAFRQARSAPGATALIVLSVALGIGTCTAIFCLVWVLALRPLPFRAPQELVGIDSVPPSLAGEADPTNRISALDALDLRAQNRSFTSVELLFEDYGLTLAGGEPERVKGALVSAGLLPLLGARPLLGRQIRAEEDRWGGESVLLLGYGLWQRRFGGDPGIVGKSILANSSSYRVAGVMPPGFAFPQENEAWIAVGPETPPARVRSVRRFRVVARLRPGVSAAAAGEDLATLGKRLAVLYPADAGWTFLAIPWRRWLIGGDLQRSALAILAAVLSVLLIACANISSLLLAQGVKRRREMALRAALGAAPRRLVRQVLTECLALAAAGGLLGIPLGIGGLSLLEGVLPPLPYGFALTPDPPALAAAFAVSLAVGLLFGLAPARHAARPDLRIAFQHAAVGGSSRRGHLHAGLIVAEVALSAVLLIAASLSIRTLSALRSAGGGSAPDHLLTVWTSLSVEQHPEARGGRLQTVVESVAAERGIESAAATNFIPLSIINSLSGQIEAEGAAPGQRTLCSAVSSGFFRTWGTPLVAGRDLTAEEGSTLSSAAVISETLARRLWPREPAARAVGRRLRITRATTPIPFTVVGVAGDFKIESLREEVRPQVFVALPYNTFRPVALVVRSHLPPEKAMAAVRRAVRSVDPGLPLFFNATMAEVSAAHLRTERLSGATFALFGAIALLFAATGTYVVLAVGVARRRREIAVRLALGAPRGVLLRRLIGRGMALTLAGLALGLLAGLAVSRALAGNLYGVTATDPVSYAGVAILLLDVAFIACWLPARKAFDIEPAEALREE